MKIVCSKCKTDMGEKEGPEDIVTHSLCPVCAGIIKAEAAKFREENGDPDA